LETAFRNKALSHRFYPKAGRWREAEVSFWRMESMVALSNDGEPMIYQQDDTRGETSPARPEGTVSDREQLTRSSYCVAQVKDSMWEAFGHLARSGASDQMRGYANQAMGKTKLTLGMATRSPDLALAGLAQIVVGEFQKSIGEAKRSDDEKDILPGL
jgi:uncharacterized protein YjbJ (UPF0337 family)